MNTSTKPAYTNPDNNVKECLTVHEGKYDAKDAKRQVFDLISNNIAFHGKRSFSHCERFGDRDQYSDNKVKELQSSKKTVQQLLDDAHKQGLSVQIESNIKITIAQD